MLVQFMLEPHLSPFKHLGRTVFERANVRLEITQEVPSIIR